MDIPKPTSKPSRRLSFSALRGELAPLKTTPTPSPSLRSSDTPSALYTSNSRGSGVASGYTECDVCGNLLYTGNGTFAPHSGNDYQSVEFPDTFYSNGALNLDYVNAYVKIINLIVRRSLSNNVLAVGAEPPTDLFGAAINMVNKVPTVFDNYYFQPDTSYLWDVSDEKVDGIIAMTINKQTVIPVNSVTTPPASTPAPFMLRSTKPSSAPTFAPHSGNIGDVDTRPSHDEQHTTTFHDENDDWMASIMHSKDDSYYCADTGDVPLSSFFERPILIYTGDWAPVFVDVPLFDLDPWSLFFDNPRVSNRLANYRNLRCNLKIKILINGTPFDYGRAMAYYVPLPNSDTLAVPPTTAGVTGHVSNSQRMHLYLDPTTNQGGTMELPYFYPYNSLLVPARQWSDLGRLRASILAPLKNCNGVAESLVVNIFAWAEDVVLSCPTGEEPLGLLPQSGKDEYGEGIISRPAAILAKIAGRLVAIPYIGRYAMAAEMGAGAVGNIAKLFGMSKPNIITDTLYVKRDEAGHFANVDRPDAIQKLSFDSKQGVTIDPRTVGLTGEDELNIVAIAKRESYLTKFTWPKTTAAGTMLFNIGVTPCVHEQGKTPLLGGRLSCQLPACAAMALPFNYWRGSMRYRFQIIKSSFHRGRLRFVYEPGTFASVRPEYNTNLSEIVDIGDNVDFVITVGWHSNQPYLGTSAPGASPITNFIKTVGPTNVPILTPVNLPGLVNGTLGVFIVNTLESPAPTATVNNDITILVSVSACDDFEVFGPAEILGSYTFSPQMGSEQVLKDPERAHPVAPPEIASFGKGISSTDATALVCYGDPVLNIRSLLKRYTHADSFVPVGGVTPLTAVSHWTLQMPAYPYHRGPSTYGVHLLKAKAAHIVNMTPVNYYSSMFVAKRGGMRNKFLCVSAASGLQAKSIVRSATSTYRNEVLPIINTSLSTFALDRIGQKYTGWSGTTIQLSNNDLFEAEVPYQATKRFLPCRDLKTLPSFDDWPIRLETLLEKGAIPADYILDRYVSVADDFNLFWFIGCPTITYLPDPRVIS